MKVNPWVATIFLALLCTHSIQAQKKEEKEIFTHQDTLRGSIGPGRMGWDVLKYDISVQPNFETKTLKGINKLSYYDTGVRLMQLDLQEPMQIDSILKSGKKISFNREGNVYWVSLRDTAAMNKIKPHRDAISIYFSGKPKEAIRPPWDGGWIWQKDKNGNPWMTVACQGLGASVWYPCKDVQSDEPDSGAILRITVPDSLMAVGNGRLTEKKQQAKDILLIPGRLKDPLIITA